jgi:hypothetical protein
MRFLALTLRRDDEKPHSEKQECDRKELPEATATGGCLSKRKERRNFWKSHNAV